MPGLEQPTQVKSSQTYNDGLAQGVGLQPAAGSVSIQDDLNSIRTQIRRIISATRGGGKWTDANVINLLTSSVDAFGLSEIHDKMFVDKMAPIIGTTQFTLGATALGVLLAAAKFPGGVTKVAVGSTSGQDLGLQVADETNFTVAGTLAVGLSGIVADADGVVLNKIDLINAASDAEPVTPTGETVFGLMQVLHGTADGSAIAGPGVENVQLSFAYYAQGTGTLTAYSLPAATYYFAPNRAHYFYSLPRGVLLGGGVPPLVDTSATVVQLPWRQFRVTGTAPAANDPMNIASGAFTTAGAQTTDSSFGTPALPATGALFRDDNRVKVWLNGQKMVKGATAGASGSDVYWISATQIAFNFALFATDTIEIETPAVFA